MFEEQALRAVLLSGGSASGLFDGALSITLWCIALLGLVVPIVVSLVRRTTEPAARRSAHPADPALDRSQTADPSVDAPPRPLSRHLMHRQER